MTLKSILNYMQRNDPNGEYDDAIAIAEGTDPVKQAEIAREMMTILDRWIWDFGDDDSRMVGKLNEMFLFCYRYAKEREANPHNFCSAKMGGITMPGKFRGMDILYKSKRKMLLFNEFDLGWQYKIYTKHDNVWRYDIALGTLCEAEIYYDRIYDGN